MFFLVTVICILGTFIATPFLFYRFGLNLTTEEVKCKEAIAAFEESGEAVFYYRRMPLFLFVTINGFFGISCLITALISYLKGSLSVAFLILGLLFFFIIIGRFFSLLTPIAPALILTDKGMWFEGVDTEWHEIEKVTLASVRSLTTIRFWLKKSKNRKSSIFPSCALHLQLNSIECSSAVIACIEKSLAKFGLSYNK